MLKLETFQVRGSKACSNKRRISYSQSIIVPIPGEGNSILMNIQGTACSLLCALVVLEHNFLSKITFLFLLLSITADFLKTLFKNTFESICSVLTVQGVIKERLFRWQAYLMFSQSEQLFLILLLLSVRIKHFAKSGRSNTTSQTLCYLPPKTTAAFFDVQKKKTSEEAVTWPDFVR